MLQGRTLAGVGWTQALRAALVEAATDLADFNLERLRQRVSQLAWRADAPSVASLAPALQQDGYTRHLLASGAGGSYQALLIAWPADHRTPLHDHDGLWGIELVLDGALSVSEYRVSRNASGTSLNLRRELVLGIGDAAAFSGDDYAHTCRNLSASRAALSLHVYGGALERYSTFSRQRSGGYRVSAARARIDTVSV